MSAFSHALNTLEEYRSVTRDIRNHTLPLAVTGLSAVHKANLIGSLCEDLNVPAIVVAEDEKTASLLAEDLNNMYGGAYVLPAKDFSPACTDGKSREFEHIRLNVLSKATAGKCRFAVLSAESALQRTIPKSVLAERTKTLHVNQNISREYLCSVFVKSGYVKADLVSGIGQFSARGDIVDFFPPDTVEPVRIDFWGDDIEKIYHFSTDNQRRTKNLSEISLTPALETLTDSKEQLADIIEKQLKKISGSKNEKAKHTLTNDLERLRGGIYPPSSDKYMPLIYGEPESIFDYLPDALVFICESAKVSASLKAQTSLNNEDLKNYFENGTLSKGMDNFFLTRNDFFAVANNRKTIFLDAFTRGSFEIPIKNIYSIFASTLPLWNGSIEQLAEDTESISKTASACVVMAGTAKNAKAVYNDLISNRIDALYFDKIPSAFPPYTVSVIAGTVSSGFGYPNCGFYLYSQGKTALSKKSSSKNKHHRAAEIHSLDEIYPGDYIVHNIHGIGIYEGVFPVETRGITKDYIKISYAKGDVLYVPVTQLDLVSKYISSKEDRSVKIHSLGGKDWAKAKSKAKASIKNIAKELVALYAKRMQIKGFAFQEDDDLQRNFELRFPYEETDDQTRCVQEIKNDMQSPHPMDRLLCGDVGFGKTEVALRAAFKCLEHGKQAAMLVPTTILALQHYQTICARMENFALNIEMLSRFRTPAQQKKIKEGLKNGKIDMVVGTHKLIGKNVEFKDLGLLIIDEEQRFGVAQKESLKSRFPEVDVLTLSATPIPRTLNMAMSGIRDMSIIEEAPQDRHPIQTYVMEYDTDIITEAMKKELRRGGQVYYLHNKIEDIEGTARMIRSLIPEASVGIAHGQMSEKQLSDIWERVLAGKIDILVCTTIIETGIDVPNVNTLIIENADRMGLAQLHQIRGRVGRSSRRASAFFTYKTGNVPSEVASKRLNAIREYTEFGSGFKIAMRDLEIRGAGNLLGAQQHGQMDSVGYDMYVKLLSEAIAEEKGEKTTADSECLVDLPITAHISEEYIPSVSQRIVIYRRISDIKTEEDAKDVLDELNDRYGNPGPDVMGLIEISLIRSMAAESGIYEINQNGALIIFKLNDMDLNVLPTLKKDLKRVIQLNANNNKPFLSVKMIKGDNTLKMIRKTLNIILNNTEKHDA